MSISCFKIFNNAPAKKIAALEACLTQFHFQRGEHLYTEGDTSDTIYLLAAGLVRFEGANLEGRGFNYGIACPEQIFGELEVALKTRRHASAIAMSEITGWLLPATLFNELFTQEAWFSRNLSEYLAQSSRSNQALYRNALTLSPPVRVANTLLWLWDNYLNSSPRGVLAFSQEELAHVLGMSRQSINKYLRIWQDLCWISVGYGCIRVLDREALAALDEESGEHLTATMKSASKKALGLSMA